MDADKDNFKITENDLPQEFILKLLGRYEAKGLWGIKHTREPVDVMVKYAKAHELSLPLVQLVVTKEGIFMSPIKCKIDNQSRENFVIRKGEAKNCFGKEIFPKISPTETRNDNDFVNQNHTLWSRMKENYAVCEKETVVNANQKDKEFCKGRFSYFLNKKQECPKPLKPITDLQLLERFSKTDWRKSGIFFFGIDTISYGVQDLIFTRVFSMIVISDSKNGYSESRKSPFMCHAFVCESRSTARKVTYALAAAFQAYGRSMNYYRQPQIIQKSTKDEKPRKITIDLMPQSEIAFNDSEV